MRIKIKHDVDKFRTLVSVEIKQEDYRHIRPNDLRDLGDGERRLSDRLMTLAFMAQDVEEKQNP